MKRQTQHDVKIKVKRNEGGKHSELRRVRVRRHLVAQGQTQTRRRVHTDTGRHARTMVVKKAVRNGRSGKTIT